MERVEAIVNRFLELSERDSIEITNLKLVKLCYIAQGFSLGIQDKPLFLDKIEAWRHGPVVPAIYHEFKHFGRSPIRTQSGYYDLENDVIVNPKIKDNGNKRIVDIVWRFYKSFSAIKLVELTHAPYTPWSNYYVPNRNNIIPNYEIRGYYKKFLNVLKSNLAEYRRNERGA